MRKEKTSLFFQKCGVVAVRMICSSADPTTTKRKKPIMMGPMLEEPPFFFCGVLFCIDEFG